MEIKGAGELSEDDEDNEEGLGKVQSARTVQEESEEVLINNKRKKERKKVV